MAKILYGVAGEGMGHATRSAVIIKHLIDTGHKVHVVTSNRAYDYLKDKVKKITITRIPGLILVYENNSLSHIKSAIANLNPKEGKEAYFKVKNIINEEKIDLIISDFEPTVAYFAGIMRFNGFKQKKIPLLSIDNIHLSSNCKVDIPIKHKKDHLLSKYITKLLIPPYLIDMYLVVSFFSPKIKNKKTKIISPILREEILKKKVIEKSHILVYQTSKSNTKMFEVLKNFKGEKFIIYGFDKAKKDDNLTFKKFSEEGMIRDISSAKAVITNGGFSLMCEAIFFHKPVLSIPVKKHFEQICNAISLEKKGYGKFCEELNTKELRKFLANLSRYKKNLKKYHMKDNNDSLRIVDETINNLLKKQ